VGHPVGRTAGDVKHLAADFPAVISGGSRDRACQNPPSAPHNIEGFLLHMGDILVKKGDVETGREIYALAKAAPTYSSWPYGNILDMRIHQAGARAQAFASGVQPPPELMFQSPYACVGCHATRPSRL